MPLIDRVQITERIVASIRIALKQGFEQVVYLFRAEIRFVAVGLDPLDQLFEHLFYRASDLTEIAEAV